MQTQTQTTSSTPETKSVETKAQQRDEDRIIDETAAEQLAVSLASQYTIADVKVAAQSFRRGKLRAALTARFAPPKAS